MIRLLLILVALVCFGGPQAAGQNGHAFGRVQPVSLPDVWATKHDGARVRLRDVFTGRRTAVQFIFVDCKTACPLLGSLFRKVDRSLGESDSQLVSITVNPQADTPTRLAEWRRSFAASPRWTALRIAPEDLPGVLRAFGEQSGPPTGHTLQVFLVDQQARFVARTTEMPSAAAIASDLRATAQQPDEPVVTATAPLLNGKDIFEGRVTVSAFIGADRLDAQAARCNGCHGAEARGGGEGKTVVPSLRSTALTDHRQRRGGPASSYSQGSFCQSLRNGVDPAGVQLSSIMPRYQMDGRSCAMLWRFLTENQ